MKIVGWISTVLPLSCWMLTIRYMYMHVHVCIKVKLHVCMYMYVFKTLTFVIFYSNSSFDCYANPFMEKCGLRNNISTVKPHISIADKYQYSYITCR